MRVRPMRKADVEAAVGVAMAAFAPPASGARPPDVLGGTASPPDVPAAEAGAALRWARRADHLLAHDAPGCWVAEDGGGPIGVALSLRRDLLWGLASLAVRPDAQSGGAGRMLLEAALGHSRGCLRGIVVSSGDPRAARLYRLSGFALHPTMRLSGRVDRSVLPIVEAVRTGTPGDRDLVDSVDRRCRGAARGSDLELLLDEAELLVCDTFTGSGYAMHMGAGPVLLGATSRLVAQRLLWETLARSVPNRPVSIDDLTTDQEWALDVGLAAGLAVRPWGYLALRHMRPPSPYIPNASFL